MLIVPVPVPAVVVKPVGAALLNAVADAAEQVSVPPLNVRFFVPAAVVKLVCIVTVKPFRSKVPFVRVIELLVVKASRKRHVPPTPLEVS